MSPVDFKSIRLNRNEALKQVRKIVQGTRPKVRFSGHALRELDNDDLTTVDAWNVLKSTDSRIHMEGEPVYGTFRYRLETKFLMLVIAFDADGKGITVVTAWDKRKGKGKRK